MYFCMKISIAFLWFVSVIVHFAQKVDQALNALGPNAKYALDDNEFIHASTLVYDGVRNVRRAVLQNGPFVCHCVIIYVIFFIHIILLIPYLAAQLMQ